MQPSVAIVILNFNGKNYLQQFLPSVVASSYPNKKIIIADNGSTDSSIQFLKKLSEQGLEKMNKINFVNPKNPAKSAFRQLQVLPFLISKLFLLRH
jgi:glycosyltransferase involved in cell wall biosynthesis